jgi:hypothetical protein
MTSVFGKSLLRAEHCWANLRLFAFNNRTVFEVFFILLYAGEQAALIILTYFLKEHMPLIISLFAIMVLSTFALHKLVMESRIKILEGEVTELNSEMDSVTAEAERLNERYNQIVKLYEMVSPKSLNKNTPNNKNKKGGQ